jgi:two-component system LytT family response regulator
LKTRSGTASQFAPGKAAFVSQHFGTVTCSTWRCSTTGRAFLPRGLPAVAARAASASPTRAREAVEKIADLKPDLVFLDVQMPELDGFGVLEVTAPENMPAVVFVTAYDAFAIRAFDAHALDYLLKPLDRDRFHRAASRAVAHVRQRQQGELDQRLRALLNDIRPEPKYIDRLVVRSGPRIMFVKVDEIDWIDAEGNYLRLHIGKRSHLLRETMNTLEAKLNPQEFMRIHRSAIVRIARIKELESIFQGEYVVTLHDGTKLTSSRGYREALQQLMDRSS